MICFLSQGNTREFRAFYALFFAVRTLKMCSTSMNDIFPFIHLHYKGKFTLKIFIVVIWYFFSPFVPLP